ncbi:MAG TPA: hypothetical protein VHF87_21885 [Methylomirabilota bacterium]|nr:hypothetical protein [Methylomirabilota bacterium]
MSDGSPEIERAIVGTGFVLNVVYYWRIHTHLRWIAAVPGP